MYASIAEQVYLCVNLSPDFTVDKQHIYYNSLGMLYTSIAEQVYLCVNFGPDFTVDKQHSYYNS